MITAPRKISPKRQEGQITSGMTGWAVVPSKRDKEQVGVYKGSGTIFTRVNYTTPPSLPSVRLDALDYYAHVPYQTNQQRSIDVDRFLSCLIPG